MATNGKFLGKDGQWYDTAQEMWSANSAWEIKQGTQERQNRLLQQQNRLIEQQNQLNYQLEQEKIQKNYELEMNKLQHEEKMRILRLFDNIGISKETYDSYINANFKNETNEELLKQKDEHLLMSSKYDYLLHEDENEEKYGFDNYDATMERYDMYSLKDSVRSNCYDKASKADLKERENLKAQENTIGGMLALECIVGVISFAICGFLSSNDIIDSAMLFWFVLLIVFAILGVIFNSKLKSIDEKLKLLPEEKLNEKKYKAKLNELLQQENDVVNKLIETIRVNNGQQLNDLYNFRIKHYNANVEKLLIDVGFKDLVESLGLEYKKINNSNKKKDGTIEDYIEYFETNS